ncbi:hypothetical protein SNEBB_008213 [Seison nebaliae]|nr:hypothetical protein SNEBB_008213 [Seison nebaliae]
MKGKDLETVVLVKSLKKDCIQFLFETLSDTRHLLTSAVMVQETNTATINYAISINNNLKNIQETEKRNDISFNRRKMLKQQGHLSSLMLSHASSPNSPSSHLSCPSSTLHRPNHQSFKEQFNEKLEKLKKKNFDLVNKYYPHLIDGNDEAKK